MFARKTWVRVIDMIKKECNIHIQAVFDLQVKCLHKNKRCGASL